LETDRWTENATMLGMRTWWEFTGFPTERPIAARILGTTSDYVTNLRIALTSGDYIRVYVDGDRIRYNFWGKPGGVGSRFPYGVAVEPAS